MCIQEDRGCPPLISGFTFASPSASTPAKGDAEAQTERVRAIRLVTDVTGCQPDVARLLLEANQWQVEAVVAQLLDSSVGEDVGGMQSKGSEVKGLSANTPVRSHRHTHVEAPAHRGVYAIPPLLFGALGLLHIGSHCEHTHTHTCISMYIYLSTQTRRFWGRDLPFCNPGPHLNFFPGTPQSLKRYKN